MSPQSANQRTGNSVSDWLQLPGAERVETVRQRLHCDPHWRYISDMTALIQVTVSENDREWFISEKGICSYLSRLSIISDFDSDVREVTRCGPADRAEWSTLLHIRRERVAAGFQTQWNSAGRDTAIHSSFTPGSSCSWGLQCWLPSDDAAVKQKQTGNNVVWIHVQVSPWRRKCTSVTKLECNDSMIMMMSSDLHLVTEN